MDQKEEHIEQIKPVPGFEGLYNASSLGYIIKLTDSQYLKAGSRISLSPTSKGYYRFYLRKDGKEYRYLAHRLIAMVFIPNPDNLPEVNHKNRDKKDNSVPNLEWASHPDNVQHYFSNRYERMAIPKFDIFKP